MHSLSFFVLLPLLGSATLLTSPNPNNKHLLRRQSDCSSIGQFPCGQYCIPSGYFCCPDKQGGCRTSQYCTTGDDGTPCCCPRGKVCDGSCAVVVNTATVDVSSPTAAATTSAPTSSSLAGSCSSMDELPCGTGCMPIGDTCCPDGSGSCAVGQVCWLNANGHYGCCPAGESCDAGNSAATSSYTFNYASSSAAAATATSAINGGVASEATSWSAARSWIMNLLLSLFGTVFVIG